MTDDMQYTPELSRPPGHATMREQLNEALRALAEERTARAQVEDDARRMADYIASRMDSRVWAHDDVLRIVAATMSAMFENPLEVLVAAKAKGIPLTYYTVADLLNRRSSELHDELKAAFASGELDDKKLANDEMRDDIISKYPKIADVD